MTGSRLEPPVVANPSRTVRHDHDRRLGRTRPDARPRHAGQAAWGRLAGVVVDVDRALVSSTSVHAVCSGLGVRRLGPPGHPARWRADAVFAEPADLLQRWRESLLAGRTTDRPPGDRAVTRRGAMRRGSRGCAGP